ncbi:hypothetical protein NKH77_39965 [Streptomyces sp. M19]
MSPTSRPTSSGDWSPYQTACGCAPWRGCPAPAEVAPPDEPVHLPVRLGVGVRHVHARQDVGIGVGGGLRVRVRLDAEGEGDSGSGDEDEGEERWRGRWLGRLVGLRGGRRAGEQYGREQRGGGSWSSAHVAHSLFVSTHAGAEPV